LQKAGTVAAFNQVSGLLWSPLSIMLYEISHAGFSVVITGPISALAKSAV